ncbi:hypothetical protein [Streptomyces griseiscabiei]|uniref:Uncharacterized protein n=1 Tax=Streptomyces griseiscabiei TaxID=2993540 RepID=A0ABU4KYZ7_9ACTN|nr:hypothetical protein [Streptomyces griseiscabiei]MBZ3904465.1 hypothetical protein [Streptomyces griseiscabiei]MDX2908214.1 hypothetical protein [Streptomyces griseiscabiei]
MAMTGSQILAELQAVDRRVLHFTPFGLGGAMRPEDAAEHQQRLISNLVLADDVAEATLQKFQQLRTCYSQGLLCYELFTLVADVAKLTLEQALRDRFVAHHGGTITVRGRSQIEQEITCTTYPDFFEQYRKADGSKIRMGSSRAWTGFNGMLDGLLLWARREGLLRGQRNRGIERAQKALRNLTAHGTFHLLSPVDAYRDLSDLAEIINHLWGHSTPGGRLYPAPITRDVVAISWNSTTVHAAHAAYLVHQQPEEDDDFTYVLARAVFWPGEREDPHLMEYDARNATTRYPAQYLWGPGSRAEAIAWFERDGPEPDCCDTLDQIFVIRVHGGRIHLPMYPGVGAALHTPEQQGAWYAIRADGPHEVLAHVRALSSAANRHSQSKECGQCSVETIARGDLATVLRAAQTAGADITPVAVPDVRTPFADIMAPRSVAAST